MAVLRASPIGSVRAIFQDSQGFIWFGTYDGLDRFDGYDFKILRNRINDSTSLPHNYISAICEDGASNLWIGMGQGAVYYNAITNIVTPAITSQMARNLPFVLQIM